MRWTTPAASSIAACVYRKEAAIAPRTVSSLRESQKDLTRERIRVAARRLFYARGVAEVSIEEIATEAKVGRATVYLHYPGKAPILRDLLEEDLRDQLKVYRRLVAWPDEVSLPVVRDWLARLAAAFAARHRSFGMFAALITGDDAVRDRAHQQRLSVIELLGGRFPGYRIEGVGAATRRAVCLLMIYQVEQFCVQQGALSASDRDLTLDVLARQFRASLFAD